VSIPYTPTAEELANPESIVIWYIDGSGNVVSVPNGRYDSDAGTVTFTTTHLSDFAVAYNPVEFNDVPEDVWCRKAVCFIAAREISKGTGNGNYSPESNLTRGDFIVLMMRAYGMVPDENPVDNFSDAGNTYYTGYLAAAKRLGITSGVGDNMFAPKKQITRQEMITLLHNALALNITWVNRRHLMQDTKYKLTSKHAFYNLAKYKRPNAGHQIQINITTRFLQLGQIQNT
jgi:hypothetical protein